MQKLVQYRVTEIYAGGDHTWAALDHNDPMVPNYKRPTPNLSIPNTPIADRTREPANSDYDGNSYYSNNKNAGKNDPVGMILEDNVLNVVFTDTEMSHRFARITFHKNNQASFDEKLERVLKVWTKEPGYLLEKHDPDCELFDMDAVNLGGNKGPKINPMDPNMRSYTLMLLNNVRKNGDYQQEINSFKEELEDFFLNQSPLTTPVGQMYQIKQSAVECNRFLQMQNLWFSTLIEVFDKIALDAKFLELRPKFF